MKVNSRLLVIILIVGAVIFTSVMVLHRVQLGRRADEFLNRARKNVESKERSNINAGIKYYGNYLGIRPDDAEVLAEYGLLLKEHANPKAVDYLEKAFRGNPSDESLKKVLKALADIMMGTPDRLSDARQHLEQLVRMEPDNADYHEQLALCLIQEENYQEAEKDLLLLIKEKPEKTTSYNILAFLYQKHLNRPADSQKIIDQMVEKNPKNPEAYRLRATYYYNLLREGKTKPGEEREALQQKLETDLAKTLELAPKSKMSLILASEYAMTQGNFDKAKKINLKLIESEPESQEGYLRMAMYEQRTGNLEKSLGWLDKGIQATGGATQLLFEKVECLLDLGRLDEVEALIRELSAAFTPPPLIAYLQARTSYAKENWTKAKDQFAAVKPELERIPQWQHLVPRTNLFLGECHRQLGNPERGSELVLLSQQSTSPLKGTNPLEEGRLLRQEGKLLEAIACFKQLTTDKNNQVVAYLEMFPTLVLRELQRKESERDWTELDKTLVEITKLLPDDPRLAVLQSQLILAKNENDVQKTEVILDEAVKRANTRTKQWDKLLAEVKNAEDSIAILDLLNTASKSWAKDNRELKKAVELIQVGNSDLAMKSLESGKQIQTNTQVLWATRIAIAKKEKDLKRAEELTKQTIHTLGDSAALRKELANIYVMQGKEEAPARLETLLKNLDKIPEKEQEELRVYVAKLLNSLGKKDRAIELYEKAAKEKPNDLLVHCDLFLAALNAGNQKVMNQTMARIEHIEQRGTYWNYLTALKMVYPLMDKKTLTEEDRETIDLAIDHLRTAEIERPNWGKSSLLLGKLYDRIGNTKAATPYLAKAMESNECDAAGLARLAEIYLQENRALEAQKVLDLLRRSQQGLGTSGLLTMAQLKFRQGDQEGAMQEVNRAVELLKKEADENKNADTYLRLSAVLQSAGIAAHQMKNPQAGDAFLKEAQETIVKASEVEPSDYRPWLVLLKIAKEQKNEQKVEELLTKIKENVPKENLHLALATCYEILNRTVEAELAYEKAMEIASDENDIAKQVASFYLRSLQDNQNQLQKAESILRKIVEGKLPAGKEDIAWARRRLALLLFPRKSQQDRREAMRLIEINLKDNAQSLPDLRILARGLSDQGNRKDKQQGLKMLEDLVKRPRPANEDRFDLAKLYRNAGNWNGVSEQMQILLGTPNPDPMWCVFYTRCMIDKNDFSSARMNWERLNAMAPNQFVTSDLEARIHAGTNQPDKAIATLQAYVDNEASLPDNELTKLSLVARISEDLADIATQKNKDDKTVRQKYLDFAEKSYRAAAAKYGKNELILASFLGRAGKQDEAIELAEKSWKVNDPQTISAATIRLLNSGDTTPKQIERVEKILLDAEKHFGESLPLDLAIAELRSMQKKYDEADKLYRAVLKKDPKNIVAMNNLAVFYALRKIKLDEALELANKSIRLAGPLATLYDTRSSVYFARKDYSKALDDIDAAIQEQPTGTRLFHQAQIQMAAGDKEDAKKSFNEALTRGLRVEQLQPLERPNFRALQEALKNL